MIEVNKGYLLSPVLKCYVMMESVEMVEKSANTSRSVFFVCLFVCFLIKIIYVMTKIIIQVKLTFTTAQTPVTSSLGDRF